jgi:hypothetical protein
MHTAYVLLSAALSSADTLAKEAADIATKVLAAAASGKAASKVISSGMRLATSAECHASRVCSTLHTRMSSVPSLRA